MALFGTEQIELELGPDLGNLLDQPRLHDVGIFRIVLGARLMRGSGGSVLVRSTRVGDPQPRASWT